MAISEVSSSSVDHRSMVKVSDAVDGRFGPVGRELMLMAEAVNSSTAVFCAKSPRIAPVSEAAVKTSPKPSVIVIVLIVCNLSLTGRAPESKDRRGPAPFHTARRVTASATCRT